MAAGFRRAGALVWVLGLVAAHTAAGCSANGDDSEGDAGEGGGGSSATGGTGGTGVSSCPTPTPAPPANGANFPFPQNRYSSRCPLPAGAPCAEKQNADLLAGFNHWKTVFVTASGAGTGGLRVQRDAFDQNDTVSEGIAYGMLIAVYMADKPLFDGLLTYMKAHRNGSGFMNWKIDASGNTTGPNGATDADEDMAWALLQAERQWGGYAADATALIDAIFTREVEAGTFVLKPGDVGNVGQVNPSYLAPSYYHAFAEATGRADWNRVADKSYEILALARDPSTGLVPDWCTPSGGPVAGKSSAYGYDACRTPWRVALDFCMYGDARALTHSNLVATFFTPVGATGIKDGYALDGTATGPKFGPMAFSGPVGAAALASPTGAFGPLVTQVQAALAQRMQSNDGGTFSYYNASWGVLSMLVLSGNFVDLRKL